MLKFKALNDDESSSSDDEDGLRNRPTKEALEEEANLAYNRALALISQPDDEKLQEGLHALEELLTSEYLTDDQENWTPIHHQTQMRLGCLKILSQTYLELLNEPISAESLLIEALKMEPENVILWIRLGSVYSKLINYRKAHGAFLRGLRCSPHNWICIESLVTLSYIILDWPQCLYFCAIGLEKDSNFKRGMVFRDEILKPHPYMASLEFLVEHQDCLNMRGGYDDMWKTKYLDEVNVLRKREEEHLSLVQKEEQEESSRVLHCSSRMKSFTFTELGQITLEFRVQVMQHGSLLRSIDMTGCINDYDSEVNEEGVESTQRNGNNDLVDEASRCSVFRSRSTSDDKEGNAPNTDNDVEMLGEDGVSQKENMDTSQKGDEDASQSQVEAPEADNNSPKKKPRTNVKWWQKEGEKRRSQRVRGQYQPASQTPSKCERGFADTLKDLIPPSLLCPDEETPNKDSDGGPENAAASSLTEDKYFGSQYEMNDVKKFIQKHGKTYIGDFITQLTLFLSQQLSIRNKWPDQLVSVYKKLYKLHRARTKQQWEFTEEAEDLDSLKQDAALNLSILEFRLDSIPSSRIENLKSDLDFQAKCFYVDTATTHGLQNDRLFNIRVNWFRVKYGINLANVGLDTYKSPLHYLKEIERLFHEEGEGIVIKLPTKTDNIISLEEVKKKIRFVQKMESVNQINDLYRDKDYDALIDILDYCLTSDDYTGTDLVNRYYLGESYFNVGKHAESIQQIVKIINPCLKSKHDHILAKSLDLFEKLCTENSHEHLKHLGIREIKALTNAMIDILVSTENRGNVVETIAIEPWCVLHNIIFHLESQEPSLYLNEDTVPHSVVLLQFAHEYLNRSNKCALDNGKFLIYTIDSIFPIRNMEEYSSFDETKHCIEQAIFCLYSHPSKKSKLKYLTDHNTNLNITCSTSGNSNQGHSMEWSSCVQLYEYYKPEKLPEFDTYESINAEVEGLFQRILSIMPDELKPSTENYETMKLILEGSIPIDLNNPVTKDFPPQYIDIYFLLGDHYFKNKEWIKAVEYYTYDLTVTPRRFDSWAAIALAKGEMINRKLNTCENFKTEEVIANTNIVVNCFNHALDLEPENSKIRIEYGSFVYAMHSFCSRLLKHGTEQLSPENVQVVEKKKDEFLKSASKCFEPVVKSSTTTTDHLDDDQHDELWIHHYMLGKVMEKVNPNDVDKFLYQYEIAGKRMSEQGAMYPAKINYYNPPELAVEALEIHYRIHASILAFIDKHDYDPEKEKILSGYIERAAASPFMKERKQNRGGGSEASENRKRQKATEEAKKEQAEIEAVMQDLLTKVELAVTSDKTTTKEEDENSSTASSVATTLSGSSDEENSTDTENEVVYAPVKPSSGMKSFGLTAFCEKMREREIQESKAMEQATSSASKPINSESNDSKKETPATTTTALANPSQDATTTVAAAASTLDSTILPVTKTAPVPPPPPPPEVEENKFSKDFADIKYGRLISQCLIALEECVRRFPQHHKSFFRIAHAYSSLAKDKLAVAKEYLLGNPSSDKKKICGLFGERKVNNFFNGVWRNPIDDIDRPGSFPYHMSKTVNYLLNILDKLNDHHMLAEMGISLSKIPDQDKQYLYNFERQQFSHLALSHCASAARRFFSLSDASNIKDAVILIFETYQKLQKFNSKDNALAGVLLECYQQYLSLFSQPNSNVSVTLDNAFRFFQHMTWAAKASQGLSTKSSMGRNWGSSGTNVDADGQPISHQFGPTANVPGMKRRKESVGRQLSRQQSQPGDSTNPSEHPHIPKKRLKSVSHGLTSHNKHQNKDGPPPLTPGGIMPYQITHDAMTQQIMKQFSTQLSGMSSENAKLGRMNIQDPSIVDLSGRHHDLDAQNTGGDIYTRPSSADVEIIEQRDPLAITPPKNQSSSWGTQSSSLMISGVTKPESPPLGISQKYFTNTGWSNTSPMVNTDANTKKNVPFPRNKATTPVAAASNTTINKNSPSSRKPPAAHQQISSSHYSTTTNKSDQNSPFSSNKKQGQQESNASVPTTPTTSAANLSMNTSPYKTQATILSNPLYEIPNKTNIVDNSRLPPPAAHSQSNRRLSDYTSGGNTDSPMEIIDLTNKSPSSIKLSSSSLGADRFSPNVTSRERLAQISPAPTPSKSSSSSHGAAMYPGNMSSRESPIQKQPQKIHQQQQQHPQSHQQKQQHKPISVPSHKSSPTAYPLPPKKKRIVMPEPVVQPRRDISPDSSDDSDVIVIE